MIMSAQLKTRSLALISLPKSFRWKATGKLLRSTQLSAFEEMSARVGREGGKERTGGNREEYW